jgi:hypothetical protein
MELSNRSIRIKELINNEVCMGTYGLVEIELKEFDKEKEFLESEIERLKKFVCKCKMPSPSMSDKCSRCNKIVM